MSSHASAHVKRFNNSITAQGGFELVTGQVISGRAKCYANRTVTLHQGLNGSSTVYATTTTDAEGNYAFGPTSEDYFTAEIARIKVPSAPGHRHYCRSANSPTVFVES